VTSGRVEAKDRCKALVGDTKRRKGGMLLCSPLPWFAAAGTNPTNQRRRSAGYGIATKGLTYHCVCVFVLFCEEVRVRG
jgi:hypothetical protein